MWETHCAPDATQGLNNRRLHPVEQVLRGCPPGAEGRRDDAAGPARIDSIMVRAGHRRPKPSLRTFDSGLQSREREGSCGPLHYFEEGRMSGFENHLRQQAAKTRVELGLDRGEDVLAREQARIDARRRQEAEMHARTQELLAEGREMLRKLRGDDSGR